MVHMSRNYRNPLGTDVGHKQENDASVQQHKEINSSNNL